MLECARGNNIKSHTRGYDITRHNDCDDGCSHTSHGGGNADCGCFTIFVIVYGKWRVVFAFDERNARARVVSVHKRACLCVRFVIYVVPHAPCDYRGKSRGNATIAAYVHRD